MSVLDQIRRTVGGSPNFTWPSQAVGPGSIVSDWTRVNNYFRYQNIYYGRFRIAFPNESAFAALTSDFGTTANLSARCVDALHSAIWQEAPQITADDTAMTVFLKDLMEHPRLTHAIEDSIRDTILYGDGVLKVSIQNSKIRVRSIHPSLYFPEIAQPDIQDPQAHNVIWRESPESNSLYRKERYWWNDGTQSWWLTETRFEPTSGVESDPLREEDLGITYCPIVHTYSNRLSGLFWGKSPMMDAEQAISEYAATMLKISAITSLASTKALLAAPYNAFDESANLAWDSKHPYMVDDGDIATFDKNKFGWLTPPGQELVEPNLSVLDRIEEDVLHSFGLAKILWGDTANLRDVGAPAIERANLNLLYTVKRYQTQYEQFLGDVFDAARELAVVHLGINQLPTSHSDLKFEWAEFTPQSELEKAQTLAAKMPLGLSKQQALRELGYANPENIVNEANQELAGSTILPHSPYDPLEGDETLEREIESVVDNGKP